MPKLAAEDDFRTKYNAFKEQAVGRHASFRDSVNAEYARLLQTAWEWYEGHAPLPLPKDDKPVPPQPYVPDDDERREAVVVQPVQVEPIEPAPQPTPVAPIKEEFSAAEQNFKFPFYGHECSVRVPSGLAQGLQGCSPAAIADTWRLLSRVRLNNTIRDCLEARLRYNLCDWAYLQLLEELSNGLCTDKNGATMLLAYLFCQSGYQMRLAIDGSNIVMLYGSRHRLYDRSYYTLGGLCFYPLGSSAYSLNICDIKFEGETPMSLLIPGEQKLGGEMTAAQNRKAKRYGEMDITSSVPEKLLQFFEKYPPSEIDSNPMTRWAMCANTPLAQQTKDLIYPQLRKALHGHSPKEAANALLNWVQTGFVYEYDNKVWGHDRAFFAEETLFYPYCDCEDRAILFSRLVRDLLGLDVALIYYPGHLAAAVAFGEETGGDAVMIGGRKFTVCDPTYIGAPVGMQMPNLNHGTIQAIVLD